LIALILLAYSSLLSNDYFDYETDRIEIKRHAIDHTFTHTGGSYFLYDVVQRDSRLILSFILVLMAVPLGILLQFKFNTGVLTIPFGLLGIFFGYSYSGKPLRLSYHGFGEVTLASVLGWFIILTGYYLQAHHLSWLPILVSLPYTVDAFKLKLLREIFDYETDKAVGRRNLVVMFGREWGAYIVNPLTLITCILFAPLLFLEIPKITLILLLVPIYFMLQSSIIICKNKNIWKDKEKMDLVLINAFTGMFMIPIALIGVFCLSCLW
jgi:1,4-dihydroxy-2-naphthoate octaprenyltransferase